MSADLYLISTEFMLGSRNVSPETCCGFLDFYITKSGITVAI